jgi:hypothetical protein
VLSEATAAFVDIGITRVVSSEGAHQLVSALERSVVVEFVERTLKTNESVVLQQKLEASGKWGKGGVGEDVVALALIALRDVTVADLARRFVPPGTALPEWAEKAVLGLLRSGEAWQYDLKSDPDFFMPPFGRAILKPSTKMRPDGIAFCPLDDGQFFTVLFSSKILAAPLRATEVEADLASTELSKLYCNRDGKPANPLKTKACMNALAALGTHVGALRVHFILPSAGPTSSPATSRVIGNDIVLYVSAGNMHLLIADTDLCTLLKK